jgi:hypothetical protein
MRPLLGPERREFLLQFPQPVPLFLFGVAFRRMSRVFPRAGVSNMKRLLALTALVVAAPLPAADAPTPGVPVVGVGMVSGDQKTVFLPAKDGGIEAIDLATGKILWSNKEGSKLAGASDKLVLAWVGDKKANEFRVVALDGETGKTAGKSDPIALPDWAVTGRAHGRTFRTAAKTDGENVTVAWQAGAFYAGGAAPTAEILAAAKKDASGIAKFDLKTGKVAVANGKPKDDDFKAGPAGGFTNKIGGYEFRSEEQFPGFKPGAPMVTKVTFTVLKDNKEVWKRELAGNPFLLPLP